MIDNIECEYDLERTEQNKVDCWCYKDNKFTNIILKCTYVTYDMCECETDKYVFYLFLKDSLKK